MSQDATPDTSADAAVVKDLLLWMRDNGFGCQTMAVGSIQLVAARDYLPSTKAQERAQAEEDAFRKRMEAGNNAETAYHHFGGDIPGAKEVLGGEVA